MRRGGVSLLGTKIGGNLVCDGGAFVNPGQLALLAQGAEIGGNATLGNGFKAEGTVSLLGTKIGGDFVCDGGAFVNPGQFSLQAQGTEIGGNSLLRQGFSAEGSVSLLGARIERNLELHKAKFSKPGQAGIALLISSARIGGEVQAFDNEIEGVVILDGAQVARMNDDPDSAWGKDRKQALSLQEFRYDQLGHRPGAREPRWQARRDWLRRNTRKWEVAPGEDYAHVFSPQPWRQCIAALERGGHYNDARRLQRALLAEERKHRIHPLFRWAHGFFGGFMFGYGLSAFRATMSVLAVWLAGIAGVTVMDAQGLLVEDRPPNLPPAACADYAAALYALDVMIPVLDLQQESACKPGRLDPAADPGGIALPAPLEGWRLFSPLGFWLWAKALYALAGAAVVGFALLTFTGTFKPKGRVE